MIAGSMFTEKPQVLELSLSKATTTTNGARPWDPSGWEVETGSYQIQGQPGLCGRSYFP